MQESTDELEWPFIKRETKTIVYIVWSEDEAVK